jgi:two-component system sensor histidine kinase PilS (NtrC family)
VLEVETDGTSEQAALAHRMKWLIGLRLLVAVLFLGSAVILGVHERSPFPLTPLIVLGGGTCLVSVVYLLLLARSRNLRPQCAFQLMIDSVLVTALVGYTGGIESPFAFVYILPILAAGILLFRPFSLLLAGGSSLLYGVLINVQLHDLLKRPTLLPVPTIAPDPGYAVFQTFVNSVAFFLVALLSSHLGERLKETGRELEERRIDLSNLQTLHRDIVANIPSGVVTLDLRGRIVSFNPAAEKIVGVAAEEVRDRHWQDTPLREVRQLAPFFSTPASMGNGFTEELQIRRRDGRPILIGITLTPLKGSDDRVMGLVGIFQDLTERRQIEARLRQADRLATVGRLAAGLAHEVRNPLAAISGSIQLIREEGMEARPQLLDIVLREADRLKLVTGQFLDFAKPGPAEHKECDLVPLLEETLSLLERSCDDPAAVTFAIRKDADRILVVADPDQVRQVLWNLGLNALQAMPAGGQLTLAARRHAPGNGAGWASVEVTDTGRGIPPGEVDRIFDPFYSTRQGGTGLGLAIARKIIDGFGGRIEVVSREGMGATFRVLLKPAPGEMPPVSRS